MGDPSKWHKFKVWLWKKLASILPKSLVYFVLIHVANVVQEDEKWGRVSISDANSRWYVKYMQKREVF